jgi:hypothetical protein
VCEKAFGRDYFFGFSGAFAGALGAALFAAALTGFIGSSQQISSHVSSHSHGFSTKTTRPHSSHLYCSPFFFAKKSPSKKPLYNELSSENIKISYLRIFSIQMFRKLSQKSSKKQLRAKFYKRLSSKP